MITSEGKGYHHPRRNPETWEGKGCTLIVREKNKNTNLLVEIKLCQNDTKSAFFFQSSYSEYGEIN
jgi:hypothetical protein